MKLNNYSWDIYHVVDELTLYYSCTGFTSGAHIEQQKCVIEGGIILRPPLIVSGFDDTSVVEYIYTDVTFFQPNRWVRRLPSPGGSSTWQWQEVPVGQLVLGIPNQFIVK